MKVNNQPKDKSPELPQKKGQYLVANKDKAINKFQAGVRRITMANSLTNSQSKKINNTPNDFNERNQNSLTERNLNGLHERNQNSLTERNQNSLTERNQNASIERKAYDTNQSPLMSPNTSNFKDFQNDSIVKEKFQSNDSKKLTNRNRVNSTTELGEFDKLAEKANNVVNKRLSYGPQVQTFTMVNLDISVMDNKESDRVIGKIFVIKTVDLNLFYKFIDSL